MGTPLLLARLSQVAEVMLSFRQTLARFRNEYKRLHYSPRNCDRTVYIFSVSRLVRWQFVVTRSSLTVAQRSAIFHAITMCRYLGGAVHHTLTDWKDSVGGVTKGGREGESCLRRSRRGAPKSLTINIL